MKKRIAFILLFSVFGLIAFSQDFVRQYKSQYFKAISGVNDAEKNMEERISTFTPDVDKHEFLNIVVHLATQNKDINEEVVKTQIIILNQFYNNIAYDKFIDHSNLTAFYEQAKNPNIVFCDDVKIVIHDINKTFEITDDLSASIAKIAPPIDMQKSINMWVVDFVDHAIGGYATAPYQEHPIDGIVINSNFFSIQKMNPLYFDQGTTLIHLMGTFLGLKELWDEYDACNDDKVYDTPIHNYANFTPGSTYLNRSLCSGMEAEMIVNQMDAMSDEYNHMFTKGQVERMKSILQIEGGRSSFVNAECVSSNTRSTADLVVSIVPNPNKGLFKIEIAGIQSDAKIEIFDLKGRKIYVDYFKNQNGFVSKNIDLSLYPSGYYICKYTEDEATVIKNFIINN